MKQFRSTTRTLDLPITIQSGPYTWSAVCAVRMSPRTGLPRVTDISDLQRFCWGVSYQFDVADAECDAVVALIARAKEEYLRRTVGVEERAT